MEDGKHPSRKKDEHAMPTTSNASSTRMINYSSHVKLAPSPPTTNTTYDNNDSPNFKAEVQL
eukprot:scaffold20100_cov142-Skeletonema_marinoi.AAC.3